MHNMYGDIVSLANIFMHNNYGDIVLLASILNIEHVWRYQFLQLLVSAYMTPTVWGVILLHRPVSPCITHVDTFIVTLASISLHNIGIGQMRDRVFCGAIWSFLKFIAFFQIYQKCQIFHAQFIENFSKLQLSVWNQYVRNNQACMVHKYASHMQTSSVLTGDHLCTITAVAQLALV